MARAQSNGTLALSRPVGHLSIILSGAAFWLGVLGVVPGCQGARVLGYVMIHFRLVLLYISTIPHFIYFANPTQACPQLSSVVNRSGPSRRSSKQCPWLGSQLQSLLGLSRTAQLR